MKTKRNRVLALVLCLTLVLGCAGIAYADNSGKQTTEAAEAPVETELPPDTISDDEAVYVLTDAAGTVEKVIVSDRIQEANGEESVTKTQEQKDLPVDVRFTYRLDGREIAPEELAGKSGRVEIRIDYTNNAWAVKEISGKEENLCVPFLTLSALLLDNEHFSNVTVDNGKLVNDGTRTVVVGYALPGTGESLALPEELDLTIPDHVTVTADAKDFALGSVYTLVANNLFRDYDEKDPDALQKLISSMNELTDAMDQLLDGAQALNDGLDTLLAKSEDLTNGVSALCDGADQVASGAGTLKTGAEKLALAGGAAQLSAGLDQLSANSAAINNGAENVFASLLSAAEAQLKANGLSISTLTISNYQTQLNQVIASLDPDAVYAQALAQVTAGVEAKRPEIEALVTASVREQVTAAVTASARQTVSEQVHAAVTAQIQAAVEENRPMIEAGVRAAVEAQIREQVTAAVAAQVRAEVIAQMGSDEVAAAIDGQITAKMNSEEVKALISSTTEQKIEEAVQAKLASSEIQAQIDAAIEEQMASDEVQALIAQNIEARMASEEIRAAIAGNTEAQVQKAIADTMAGSEVQGKLAAAAEGAKSVIALKTSLDQYNAFYLGIQSYTAGVDAAAKGAKDLSSGAAQLKTGAASLAGGSATLASGTKTLSEGADSLSSGAATLSGGTNQLAAGAHTMKDSLPDLIDGITQLRDGSDALRTGMEQFNADGIQKLSQLVTVDGAGFAERLKAIASIGKEYRSAYTGLSDDAEGELRFIYRTAAIGE